jgi:hypothetical protein
MVAERYAAELHVLFTSEPRRPGEEFLTIVA